MTRVLVWLIMDRFRFFTRPEAGSIVMKARPVLNVFFFLLQRKCEWSASEIVYKCKTTTTCPHPNCSAAALEHRCNLSFLLLLSKTGSALHSQLGTSSKILRRRFAFVPQTKQVVRWVENSWKWFDTLLPHGRFEQALPTAGGWFSQPYLVFPDLTKEA